MNIPIMKKTHNNGEFDSLLVNDAIPTTFMIKSMAMMIPTIANGAIAFLFIFFLTSKLKQISLL